MLTTLPRDKIYRPAEMRLENEYHWSSALLPPESGALLVDLDWSEGKHMRTQSLVCAATVDSAAGMHVHQIAIIDIMYIPASRHDGTGRQPVLRIDGVDTARDPARRYVPVLLVRTLDGCWHSCDPEVVVLDALVDRAQILRVEAAPRPSTSGA
jgi:hypothetical protein